MASNIPYKGVSKAGLKRLTKKSKSVTSFAGAEYVSMHKATIQELHTQKERNAKAAQKSLHMVINSGVEDSLDLQPEIQRFVDGLRKTIQDNKELFNTSLSIDPIDDALLDNLCELAVSNIAIENQIEPKAEKILVRGEKAKSRKLYNIRFNIKGMISLLFDWLLLGDITEVSLVQVAVMMVRSIGTLYDLALIDFDYIHALILQEGYRAPKRNGGIEEDKLIDIILTKYGNKYPDLSKTKLSGATNELQKFHCLDIEDGMLYFTESIVIK